MIEKILTQKRLQELLHYCPETGIFTWLVSAGNAKIGDVAGYMDSTHRYIFITVDYRLYRAHRLAFLYMTGEWPINQVDHDDHIRSNNRWKNLNQATSAANNKNRSMRSDNTSGIMGVSWRKVSSKWQARIVANGQRKNLGTFAKIEDAVAARKEAERKYGYHENHGSAQKKLTTQGNGD